ncbi:MAG: hypothetical protein ABSB15_01090 [Bryobacteraceae bacterium]|jgi:photosystem II stability/assembly factor-like uncharacterized protein
MTNRIALIRQFAVRLLFYAAALAITVAGQRAFAAWRATGPFGGDAEVIRVVPRVKDLVIAAAHDGLVYSSANGGASWTNIAFPAQFAGVLHALEVDPRSAAVWYVGMESGNEWTSGVYKTGDAGHTWTLLPQTRGLKVWSLALAPGDADVIAAGTGSGIFLSRDAGAMWNRISPADDPELRPVVSLAFHPTDVNILYAGTTHLPWRTTNGGASWQSIHEGMMDDSDVFSIQVDPLNPARVFASACSGVYGSTDGASRWARLETPKGAFRTHFVAIDPKNTRLVFAGTTEGLLRSVDGGRVWRKVSAESIKSIAFDPWVSGRIFFASTTAGLLISTDGGTTLREVNAGFTNRNFTTLTGAGNLLYSSSVYEPGSGGVYRTDEYALRWVHEGDPLGDQLLLMAAVPDNPNVLFAAGYHSLLQSNDRGISWAPRKVPAGSRVTALLPVSSGLLLAATDEGLFRSGDGGIAWTRSADGRLTECAETRCTGAPIEALRSSGKRIVSALTSSGAVSSADGAITWKKCGEPAPGTAWYGLDFDSSADGTALAATSAGLFRSTDGCVSWTPVRAGLRAETATFVLFHPTHSGEAFVSQGGKIFRSTDGGQRWLPLDDEGIGNSGPSSLFVLPASPDRLFALFPRRGVFSTSIKEKPLQ